MVAKPKEPTHRLHIVLTHPTWLELVDFVTRKYGGNRGLSLTIERAVREFLAHEAD